MCKHNLTILAAVLKVHGHKSQDGCKKKLLHEHKVTLRSGAKKEVLHEHNCIMISEITLRSGAKGRLLMQSPALSKCYKNNLGAVLDSSRYYELKRGAAN